MPLTLRLTLLVQPIQDTSSFHQFQEGVPQHPPPVPGGVMTVLRAIFNAPLWAWLLGIALGLAIVFILGRQVWTNRQAIWHWLVTSDRGVKLALGASAALVLGLVAWFGVAGWNYMEHENDFCVGCHIMEGPWNKFATVSGKHDELGCHDCHQQSLYASTRQLVLWVANRPEKIPPHAPVSNERCEACHAQDLAETWTRIQQTAGHRTHLESDSTALAEVTCLTCHGAELHKFAPVDQTCGQSGCHDNQTIQLGKMAMQTSLHCVQCHEFTADVPLLATRDSAAGTLRPAKEECLTCHEMQRLREGFDPVQDPHKGVCGTCHNPHTQETPAAARQSCAQSGCHSDWQSIPFHVGALHRRAGEQCVTCHDPHASRLDPSDCVACHTKITRQFGSLRLRPPLPFDTARALRPTARHESRFDEPVRGKGDVPPPDLPPSVAPALASPAPADSFPHARHEQLACITCHGTGTQHGQLTFEAPRGCQICHHQRAQQGSCATCHRPGDLETLRTLSVPIATKDRAPRHREIGFAHATHAAQRCVDCHAEPVTMAPSEAARTCTDCHSDHHTAARACATCHTGADLRAAHADNVAASHQACDACHTASTVVMLTPDRSFCSTCHTNVAPDHYPQRECSTCHFLKPPAEFRPWLTGRPAP